MRRSIEQTGHMNGALVSLVSGLPGSGPRQHQQAGPRLCPHINHQSAVPTTPVYGHVYGTVADHLPQPLRAPTGPRVAGEPPAGGGTVVMTVVRRVVPLLFGVIWVWGQGVGVQPYYLRAIEH